MNTLLLSLLPALLAGATPPQAPAAGPPALEIDGTLVGRTEVALWLTRFQGEFRAPGFARMWRVHEAAERAGLAPSLEVVRAEVEERIRARVEQAFGGDRDAWRAELESVGNTEDSYRAQQELELGYELELAALARSARGFEDAELAQAFEQHFGRDGVTLELRLIEKDVVYPPRLPGETRDEANAKRKRVEDAAFEWARALRERVAQGESFEALARTKNEDEQLRERAGRLAPGLDTRGLREETIAALYALEPGAVSEPVFARGSLRLYQLVSKQRTSFEDARDELIRILREEEVAVRETDALLAQLEAETPLRRLPALVEEVALADHDPSQPVLELGTTLIDRETYGFWLCRKIGNGLAREYVQQWLVTRRAAELGLSVTDEEIAERVASDLQAKIDFLHKGDAAAWEAELATHGHTRAMYENQAGIRARADLLAEKLLLRDLEVTPAMLRQAFEREYGPGGRTRRVRWIACGVKAPSVQPGTSQEEFERALEAARQEALERIVPLHERIENGEDFATLARKHSDDPETNSKGGLPDGTYDPLEWNEDVRAAIDALKPGHVTEPVYSVGAWYVFELLEDRTVEYESVEAQLRDLVKTSRPPSVRVAGFLNMLSKEHPFEVLSGLYRD